MNFKLRIERFDPATGETRLQPFELDVRGEAPTLLDCLEQIKDDVDGTLAFRRSCREGTCGSCAVRIDGRTALACRTTLAELIAVGGTPTVAPIGNHPVLRDLVVETEAMWKKFRAVEPFLNPRPGRPADGRETLVSPAASEGTRKEALCINCGACVSECDAMTVSPEFLGPHALAKAWRFVGDVREGEAARRLEALSGEHGIWECTRCYLCNERCPRGVDPRDAIAKLGAEAIRAGHRPRPRRQTRRSGSSPRPVPPAGCARPSWCRRRMGILASLKSIPLALRLFRHGKAPLPSPPHKAKDSGRRASCSASSPEQDRRGASGRDRRRASAATRDGSRWLRSARRRPTREDEDR